MGQWCVRYGGGGVGSPLSHPSTLAHEVEVEVQQLLSLLHYQQPQQQLKAVQVVDQQQL